MSNFYKAFEADLDIVPVVNKIDSPAADVKGTVQQIKDQFFFNDDEMIHISAMSGQNVEQVFKAIVERIKSPMFQTKK